MDRTTGQGGVDVSSQKAAGSPASFRSTSLVQLLVGAVSDPARVRDRTSDRLAYAHDASHYLLTPAAVVVPATAAEVGSLMRVSADHGVPLTFRAGGTSLSGQGVTDGILVDVRRNFRDVEVLDGGERVRVQPGATVRNVNARLASHGRKLGPDPASEAACTLGGVIANNSSGMACGTWANPYQTLDSVVLVLPSGTVIDSAAEDADARLRALEPELHRGLLGLRDRVRGNPESVRTIERQFSIKNTMGYALNAFLDYEHPVDILTRLVVGSEGTLAFIAEATLRTVPLHAHAATGLLLFDSLAAATAALPTLLETKPATVELMDAASLKVAQGDPQADASLRGQRFTRHAGLLVEFQDASAEGLQEHLFRHSDALADLHRSAPSPFTTDPATRRSLWHLRKGLYAAVAGARPPGTIALLEDVAVPVAALLPTCGALTELFEEYGYDQAVMFGHAKDGNVHFMLTDRFEQPAQLARYRRFTEAMVELILGQGGSLKAEHGTGRNMAPYVARQYGQELYEVMRQLKALCDPAGMLNPGIILNDDPEAHLRHLKVTPKVDPEVDRCVECGFCEPVCPSRDLTTTPRQRIVLRRAMADAQAQGDLALLSELQDAYQYDAVETCAVDGMCQTACPVSINTGDLVKRLRAEGHGQQVNRAAASAARHWGSSTKAAAALLDAAAAVPAPLPAGITRATRRVLGHERVPLWSKDLPSGGSPRKSTAVKGSSAAVGVYFASCVGSLFGPAESSAGVGPALAALCQRAGVQLAVVPAMADLCCGTPWRSKGLTRGYEVMQGRVLPALWEASDSGRIPIISDATSCSEGLAQLTQNTGDADDERFGNIRIIDAVSFALTELLPRLTVRLKLPSLALHPTCSSTRLGLDQELRTLAAAMAERVVVPADWGCCGFAGDRGLLHPELTAAATQPAAAELATQQFAAYTSCNRTCEIGMTRATQQRYQHILEVLEELTRPA